jgi:hypothetical protein
MLINFEINIILNSLNYLTINKKNLPSDDLFEYYLD